MPKRDIAIAAGFGERVLARPASLQDVQHLRDLGVGDRRLRLRQWSASVGRADPGAVDGVQAAAISGLGVESLYLLLPALATLLWFEGHGSGGFGGAWGIGLSLLLVMGGALTALPLIGFAYAVRRVPLSVVGVMQYIAPTLQLLIGVLVFNEAFDRDRAIGFGLIWAGLAIFAIHGFARSRRSTVPAG